MANETGGKHTPNTSETSHPHTSKDHPDVHVDTMHFNDQGKHDSTHDVDGITYPGMISLGEDAKDWHDSQKSE
jgi:hypothetical protein